MAGRISEYFKIRKQEKEEFIAFLEDVKHKISVAGQEYQELFRNPSAYVDVRKTAEWKSRFSRLHDEASSYLKNGMIEKKKLPRRYEEPFSAINTMYANIDRRRAAHNRKALSGSRAAAEEAFRRAVSGRAPAEYQIEAILSENQNLLISGAPSTGKSAALKAKAEYLKSRGLREGEELVFLRGGDLRGFASFARDVLAQCGMAPASPGQEAPCEEGLPEMLRGFLAEKQSEPSYRSRLIDYYLKFHVAGHTAFEFEDYGEYQKYIALYPPVSLKGERLNSYEELDIANFLYALGIEYEYHAPFPEEVILQGERTRYKPDFTLKDYKVCINVYEIDEEGNAAGNGALSFSDKETLSKQLQERLEEIQKIHEEAELPLIACFSREKHSGSLLPRLQAGLSACGVTFDIKSDDVLLDAILALDPAFIDVLAESIRRSTETILSLNMTEETVLTLSRTKSKTSAPLYKRHERLLSLILPFYNYYIARMPSDDYRIIARAANVLSDYKAMLGYRYVFVDDLENINACEARLIIALSQNCGCAVAAAGCDWCSAIGWHGADPLYLQDFGRFFPGFEEIECTRVWNLSKGFFGKIQELALDGNGYAGYSPVCSNSDEDKNTVKKIEALWLHYDSEADVQEKFTALLASLPEDWSVLVACRYERDVLQFSGPAARRQSTDCIPIFQAWDKYDAVVWVNTKYTEFGFPDERICLNDLSALLLRRPDASQYTAERNLLCRAMSLAKSRFILLCDSNNASAYVGGLGLSER